MNDILEFQFLTVPSNSVWPDNKHDKFNIQDVRGHCSRASSLRKLARATQETKMADENNFFPIIPYFVLSK